MAASSWCVLLGLLESRGLVDPKDMNGLLGEIGEQLASRTSGTSERQQV